MANIVQKFMQQTFLGGCLYARLRSMWTKQTKIPTVVKPTIVGTDYNQHWLELSELNSYKIKSICKNTHRTRWGGLGEGVVCCHFKWNDQDRPNWAGDAWAKTKRSWGETIQIPGRVTASAKGLRWAAAQPAWGVAISPIWLEQEK